MARHTPPHNSVPIIDAAQHWVRGCLVSDGSVFGNESISTSANFDQLNRFFVQRPDVGDGSFYEKLETQVGDAVPGARKLMAELLWALFLFPSNIGADTKREGVLRVWGWSGDALDPAHPVLTDTLLDGVGSAGMGVNTNRWREIKYLIGLGRAVKGVQPSERAQLFDDYDRYMEWMKTVPQEGDRQFRHMLRFFLFPDRVERMSSNGDRIRVLNGFRVVEPKVARRWTDRQLDDALLALRQKQVERYGTTELDFYVSPLKEEWRKPNDPETKPGDAEDGDSIDEVQEEGAQYGGPADGARNLILYGPPGTGKTYRMQKMFGRYTDQPADVDRSTWELQLVGRYGWRAAIAAAVADLGKPARAADIELHPLIGVKSLQRKRVNSVRATLWSYLQEHTSPDSSTVNVSARRPPYVFAKNSDSEWSVVADWQEVDAEACDLLTAWHAGPASVAAPVQRYRVVTFHPSYSYEDFIIGLRPVVRDNTTEGGSSDFRMVDGVFKRICIEARTNPAKRYALFIDEINRANIAKVFGELITLIEPNKRARYAANGSLIGGMEVQLPGTGGEDGEQELFGVPENLDIIGTMNTADRSIALLDIALRRRFEFEQIPPDYRLLDRRIDGVDLGKLLMSINARLEFLADRDRLIGHAYFMRVTSIDDLRASFRRQVIPLLQEYFFDDWGRVELVLSGRNGRSTFIRRETLDGAKLFVGAAEIGSSDRQRHDVTLEETWTAEAFRSIYEDIAIDKPVLA